MREELNTPHYILKGKNWLRSLFIFLLTGVILFGIFIIQFVGFIMIFVILGAVFGLITIRFPYIYLYADYFSIEKKCILKKFSKQEIIKYKEISEIEFVNGYINWSKLILLTALGKGAYGGFSKPDLMILRFQDNSEKIFYRIGSKAEFEKVFQMIHKKL